MRLSVVFKEKRDKFFFLIKRFHLIEKNQQKNKHRLLLEKFFFFFGEKSQAVSICRTFYEQSHLKPIFMSRGSEGDAE